MTFTAQELVTYACPLNHSLSQPTLMKTGIKLGQSIAQIHRQLSCLIKGYSHETSEKTKRSPATARAFKNR